MAVWQEACSLTSMWSNHKRAYLVSELADKGWRLTTAHAVVLHSCSHEHNVTGCPCQGCVHMSVCVCLGLICRSAQLKFQNNRKDRREGVLPHPRGVCLCLCLSPKVTSCCSQPPGISLKHCTSHAPVIRCWQRQGLSLIEEGSPKSICYAVLEVGLLA